MEYNLQFNKLCNTLDLGDLVSAPLELSGGLMNRMFMLETSKSKYAVKAINPTIMLRADAMQNYINSEKVATVVSNNIKAMSALHFNNKAVQTIDGQHYLIFNWCNGTHLFGDDISIEHCEKMGKILANIHMTDFSSSGLTNLVSSNEINYDWNFYLNKGIESNAVWCDLLQKNIENLYKYNKSAENATVTLSSDMVISHADLEPKNTMWINDEPYIIDWEAAGFVCRYHDILETALYWSRDIKGNLVKDKFITFIKSYKSVCSDLDNNWEYALNMGYSGMLGWLEYSLKRSLWLECSDEDENRMGTDQVFGTIDNINKYTSEKDEIISWLNEV